MIQSKQVASLLWHTISLPVSYYTKCVKPRNKWKTNNWAWRQYVKHDRMVEQCIIVLSFGKPLEAGMYSYCLFCADTFRDYGHSNALIKHICLFWSLKEEKGGTDPPLTTGRGDGFVKYNSERWLHFVRLATQPFEYYISRIVSFNNGLLWHAQCMHQISSLH